MAEQVQAEHAVPAAGQLLGKRAVHSSREEQPGEQQDDPVTAAVFVVDEPVAVELEVPGLRRGQAAEDIPFAPGCGEE